MPMPVSPVPSFRKGSLERDRFEGAEAKKASVLTELGARCPPSLQLLRPAATPGARGASRSPAGPVHRRERAGGDKGQRGPQRGAAELGVRARELRSQGGLRRPQCPPPSPGRSGAPRTPTVSLQRASRRGRAAGGGAPRGADPRSVRWGYETVGSATLRRR